LVEEIRKKKLARNNEFTSDNISEKESEEEKVINI
jgi:hypothetical protein